MDPSKRNRVALDKRVNDLVDTLTSSYIAIFEYAEQEDNVDYSTTAQRELSNKKNTAAFIRACEDLSGLVRELQELWLFGGLDTLTDPADDDANKKKAVGLATMIETLAKRKAEPQQQEEVAQNGESELATSNSPSDSFWDSLLDDNRGEGLYDFPTAEYGAIGGMGDSNSGERASTPLPAGNTGQSNADAQDIGEGNPNIPPAKYAAPELSDHDNSGEASHNTASAEFDTHSSLDAQNNREETSNPPRAEPGVPASLNAPRNGGSSSDLTAAELEALFIASFDDTEMQDNPTREGSPSDLTAAEFEASFLASFEDAEMQDNPANGGSPSDLTAAELEASIIASFAVADMQEEPTNIGSPSDLTAAKFEVSLMTSLEGAEIQDEPTNKTGSVDVSPAEPGPPQCYLGEGDIGETPRNLNAPGTDEESLSLPLEEIVAPPLESLEDGGIEESLSNLNTQDNDEESPNLRPAESGAPLSEGSEDGEIIDDDANVPDDGANVPDNGEGPSDATSAERHSGERHVRIPPARSETPPLDYDGMNYEQGQKKEVDPRKAAYRAKRMTEYNKRKNAGRARNKNQTPNEGTVTIDPSIDQGKTCNNCGLRGHITRECSQDQLLHARCFRCFHWGHLRRDCNHRRVPKHPDIVHRPRWVTMDEATSASNTRRHDSVASPYPATPGPATSMVSPEDQAEDDVYIQANQERMMRNGLAYGRR